MRGRDLKEVSDSVREAMIAVWRLARLTSGVEHLGFPRVNILAKASRSGQPAPMSEGHRSDAEIVQAIVEQMPDELREAFEARHLYLIAGRRFRQLPHKSRAARLQIPIRTYWRRVDTGHRFVGDRLQAIFDKMAQI